jgi:hypothetical protein
MGNAIKGLIWGVFLGGLAGLGVCIWLISETLLFPGDTMVAGALICGTCGYIYGDSFFEWLKDNWNSFV